ncbi:MAG: biliverdin-producing heme oxygenase [Acetobacteraceae bacterium]|nr:biliverdin-producing heme oxygenase [Acetobacteraceae bacterium]
MAVPGRFRRIHQGLQDNVAIEEQGQPLCLSSRFVAPLGLQCGRGSNASDCPGSRVSRLSAALRAHVQLLHTEAERTGLVGDVLRGRATPGDYALWLRNLLPTYQEMEAALERYRGRAPFIELARPELYRAEAIISDLHRLTGGWHRLPLLHAGSIYAQQVAQAATGDGHLLIAHVYTRYLGDLSGGLVLKRVLARLPGAQSFRFHDFPGIADRQACQIEFRAAIDRAGAQRSDWTDILVEGAAAFRCNIELSKAIQAVCADPAFPL